MSKIVVLRPDAPPQQLSTTLELVAREPLPERPMIGLVDNGKALAKELLLALTDQISRRIGRTVDIMLLSKPSPSHPISDDEATQLAGRCDVVISGLGDCGACSASSVHDALKIEIAGTAATVLITEPFQALVASNAAKLGAPGYHTLTIPHPVWGKNEAELRTLASQVVDAAILQLTVPVGGAK